MAGRWHVHGVRNGSSRRWALAATIIAALAGAPGTAWTQTAPATEPVAVLQEIVVTSTRHEESLSKVPLSVTALTQESLDVRGIKDFQDVARFTPGVNIDKSGTNNIAIRGIASSGGAGTTGIYIDDTPIQMRALAFNPDDALPKSFDIERVEVLRGPQGTLFGAGSVGGTVRYITTQPSLTKTSVYSRSEISATQGGDPSYEIGVAGGTPVIDGTLGVRASVWYREDGGWIDRIDPVTLATVDKRTNHAETTLVRLAAVWAPSEHWSLTPSIYYQDRQKHDVDNYWPLYSDSSNHRFVSANPTGRPAPDTFYLPALKIEGDIGSARLISNTSYYHRKNTTGYDGTLYNLGFYQTLFQASAASNGTTFPLLLDGGGLHMLPGTESYRAPASVQNGQQNFTQEIRLQSVDPNAPLIWTTGIFYSNNRQTYLEQINDPQLQTLLQVAYPVMGRGPVVGGDYVTDFFGVGYDPGYPTDSYFLNTSAKDEQLALFGEGTYSLTDTLKATVGLRFSKTKFTIDTLTGGPQLFLANQATHAEKSENSFTPKLSFGYQMDSRNLFYATYAKGFRPGGGNNPVPQAACATDFAAFGITEAPPTFNSDTVNSYEIGAKNNFNNRVKLASSVYYIQWNNIQQTVVPPSCQISFIANLGEAVAKGADVQAEIAMGGSVTLELAAGYTDARYTKDSRLSPTEQVPVVASGNSIVGSSSELSGQPPSPVTASVGLEYKFGAFSHEAFVRADYQYSSKPKWVPAKQYGDPLTCTKYTLQYDCANFSLDATNFVTLRGGITLGSWEVAAFVDNLMDSHTLTDYNWTIDPSLGTTAPAAANSAERLRRDFTYRPRTFGFTFTYRN